MKDWEHVQVTRELMINGEVYRVQDFGQSGLNVDTSLDRNTPYSGMKILRGTSNRLHLAFRKVTTERLQRILFSIDFLSAAHS